MPELSSHSSQNSSQNSANADAKISELEQLVQTISRGKYMWESTFDAISSPVIIVSSDYKVVRANKAAAKAARVDVRQMIGGTCHELLASSQTPCHGCPLRKTLDQNKPASFLLDPFHKSNEQYEVNAYPIESPEKEKQVVLHYRDVTAEKKLQRQLLQNEKMAAIGMLAGGIAHEINNPLGGILAFAQLAMKRMDADHEVFGDLKEIENAALRCKTIVRDLLDFSRQSEEQAFKAINLNDVVDKMKPILQVLARNSRIEIEYDLADNLPLTNANFNKIEQVFLNLATNSFQAMGQGGRLVLKTFDDSTHDTVVVTVADTGPGISKENLEKIFDPYFTTKKQGEGTGLGLSITYGIVKEHQANIEVSRSSEQGTEFKLTFPKLGDK